MRELLGEKDRRRLELVEKIYLNPGITIDELSETLFLTAIQLQTDLGFLQHPLAPIEIEVNRSRQCFLKIPATLSIKHVYRVFLENSLVFRLLEAIFFHEYENYDKLATELFVSQATLKRAIAFANRCFDPHDIRIKSRPVRLEGDEINIRAFFNFYFQERYPDDDYPFAEIEKNLVSELADLFIRRLPEHKQNYASRNRLNLYLLVSLIREKQHHVPLQVNYLTEIQKHRLADELASFVGKQKFEHYFKLKLTPELYLRLFRQYLNSGYAFSASDYSERISENPQNRQLYDGVYRVVSELSRQLDIPVLEMNELVLKIYNVLSTTAKLTITPYILFPNRKSFLLLSRHLQEAVQQQTRQLFNHYLPAVAERNQAYFYEFFYLLVTHWPDFYHYLIQLTPPCRVGLFFNSDVEHMTYMKAHLQFLFGEKITVEILNLQTVEELTNASAAFDLIVINFVLPARVPLATRYISVIDVLSQDDVSKIGRVVNEQYYHNMRL